MKTAAVLKPTLTVRLRGGYGVGYWVDTGRYLGPRNRRPAWLRSEA